ncbi:carbohydrate porin [Acetobacter farinalis]|uniref:Carbohydrate porin n=1 Tax=Acetobacter farinalis TaxID=1260984 RepID=A0ABT3QA82_9PROT|nr:carbohydrate porin [Acetobacter farinalis]MCX2562187.1 carbohydrate porin [Acetobacter farinalis]
MSPRREAETSRGFPCRVAQGLLLAGAVLVPLTHSSTAAAGTPSAARSATGAPFSPPVTHKRSAGTQLARTPEQSRLEAADARMAAIYAAWPVIRPPTPEAPPTHPYQERFFGNWAGLLPHLSQYGITLSANYLGMAVGNVAGGMRRGVDYAGQISTALDVDWGRLANMHGFSTHLFLLNRTGRPVGRDYVGDSVFNENEIYGAGGNVIAHLGYAFAEQKLWHERLDLMAGRMGAAMLFNASPLYCDFFSFGLCPTPRAITGGSQNAFIMPPQNNWSFYASLLLAHDVYLRSGINAVGGPLGGRSGFNWSSHGVTGVMLPFEAGWTPRWGADHKPFHLQAGFYGATAQADDIALNRVHQLRALAGGQPLEHRGYLAAWAGGDIMILRQTSAPDGGLVAFFNYNHSDDRISPYRDMGILGAEDRGFWSTRPQDRLGFLFLWSRQSHWLAQHQKRAGMENVGVGSIGSMNAEIGNIQSQTGLLEFQYGAHIAPGTILTPDVQYVIRPGATGRYHNATVLGASLQASL